MEALEGRLRLEVMPEFVQTPKLETMGVEELYPAQSSITYYS